jgi:hypothetical protein
MARFSSSVTWKTSVTCSGPSFADDGDGGRFGVEQHLDLRIVLDLHLAAAGHAKGGDLRGLPGALGGFLEEGGVLGVRAGPAAFDVVHAEVIELFGDADFVEGAEGDAGALGAVTQGGVVDGNWRHVSMEMERVKGVRNEKTGRAGSCQEFRDAGGPGRLKRGHKCKRTLPAASGAGESEANSDDSADVRAVSHERFKD